MNYMNLNYTYYTPNGKSWSWMTAPKCICTWLIQFLHDSGIIWSNDWAIKFSKYLSRNSTKVRSPRPTSSSILFSPSACLALSTAWTEFHMASIGFSGAEYGHSLRIDKPAYWGSLTKVREDKCGKIKLASLKAN